MKKLKIFLLLSILLCFSLVLSFEVHAESETNVTDLTGTKWLLNESITTMPNGALIDADNYAYETFNLSFISNSNVYSILHFQDGDYGANWERGIYYDSTHVFQYSAWTNEAYRTIEITGGTDVTNAQLIAWFESNAILIHSGYSSKKFEEGDILPAGYIKISWDFTDITFGDDDELWIYLDDIDNPSIAEYIHVYKVVLEYETIILDMYDKEVHADTTGNIIITLNSSYIVTSIQGVGDLPYEYINDALTWEVVSQDYADGYEDGYADAEVSYGLGYGHARETYGYYDPITEQWLSVAEYLNLYGTDKLGQSDFYDNFDKYFIPAMIIVFGGAIVLTILKVFKGRE